MADGAKPSFPWGGRFYLEILNVDLSRTVTTLARESPVISGKKQAALYVVTVRANARSCKPEFPGRFPLDGQILVKLSVCQRGRKKKES
jgi:hypothetical protein